MNTKLDKRSKIEDIHITTYIENKLYNMQNLFLNYKGNSVQLVQLQPEKLMWMII